MEYRFEENNDVLDQNNNQEQENVIQHEEQENNSVEEEKKCPTVLIVEDEDSERISLKTVLVAENIAVESACDGEEALYLIKKRFFDIVIVDYRLPDIDGLTLIKRIKAINADSMPIVVTAHSSIEIAIEAMKTGAYDYIVKPLDIPRLLNIMNKIMEDTKVLLKSKQILKEIVGLGRIDYVTDKDNIIVVTTPDTGILSENNKNFSLKKILSLFKGIKNYYWG